MLHELSNIVSRKFATDALKVPTPELVTEGIDQLISEIMNKTLEQMTQPSFSVLDQVDNPYLG